MNNTEYSICVYCGESVTFDVWRDKHRLSQCNPLRSSTEVVQLAVNEKAACSIHAFAAKC